MNKRTESNDIIFNKYHPTMLASLNSLTEWADEIKQRKRFIQFIRLNKQSNANQASSRFLLLCNWSLRFDVN